MKNIILTIIMIFFLSLNVNGINYNQNFSKDSRIRQFIYHPNHVYQINVMFGFISLIEFEKDEIIQNISAGNDFLFSLTHFKNNIFINPMESNAKTNVTIVTNKRRYFFDINCRSELTDISYIVSFYYPDSLR